MDIKIKHHSRNKLLLCLLIISPFAITMLTKAICSFSNGETLTPGSARQVLYTPTGGLIVGLVGGITTYPVTNCSTSTAQTFAVPGIAVYPISPLAFLSTASCNKLLVADYKNSLLHIYTYNTTSNTLGTESQTALAAPNSAGSVAVSANNACIAVASGLVATISTYSVNPTTCVVTAATTNLDLSSLTKGPLGRVAFSPSTAPCNFLIVNGSWTYNPSVMIPVNANGTLGTPVAVPGGNSGIPTGIAFSPNGQYVAITYLRENVIRIFQINANCTLTLLQTTGAGFGPGASDIVYTPDSNCLIAAYGSNVTLYSLNGDGTIGSNQAASSAGSSIRSLAITGTNCSDWLLAMGLDSGVKTDVIF